MNAAHSVREPNQSYGACASCGKRSYKTRKAAKQVGRSLYPSAHLSAYRCVTGWWHYGNIPDAVIDGTISRDQINPMPSREDE